MTGAALAVSRGKKKKIKNAAKKLNSGQITPATEINGAAATRELEMKEKVEVVQELGEIPQLGPVHRRSFAELKEREQSLEKGANLCEKSSLSLGKRKKQLLLLESPKSKVTGQS